MLAWLIARVARDACRSARRIELEPDEEHEEDDADLREQAEVAERAAAAGASRTRPGATAPRSDGPSTMPATISPMTRG